MSSESLSGRAEEILSAIKITKDMCREKVAEWMMKNGYATGHGDTIEDLLGELQWQINEQIRNAGTL